MARRRKKKPATGSLIERVRGSLRGDDGRSRQRPPPPRDAGSNAAPPVPRIEIEKDGLEAVIVVVYPGHTASQIATALSEAEVTHGVDGKAIRHAVKQAAERGKGLDRVVAARGDPPRSPGIPELQLRLPEGMDRLPDLESLREQLGAAERAHVEKVLPETPVWAVGPGELVATADWKPGATGTGVRGEEIAPPPPDAREISHLELMAGPGVEVSGDTKRFSATRWGYLGLMRDQLSVLQPVWVQADGSQACLLTIPWVAGSTSPTPADLRSLLADRKVQEGIDDGALDTLCEQLADNRQEDALTAIATGRAPQYPHDAEVDYSFRYESGAGNIRADGSIDFRERNAFPPVEADDTLARCHLAVPGQDGLTVRGESIAVRRPRKAQLVAGENVRLVEEGGLQEAIAEIDGGAIVQVDETRTDEGEEKIHTIAVQPVTQVSGDVDYHSGNIDVPGNVIVGGSVAAGFRVKAGGDVAISGSIEAGALVSAGGSITVQQGIVGESTHVDAGGGVTAKFVQDAAVEAVSDIVLGSYARGARLSTFGRVHVEGAGGTGGLAGGRTWAMQGITTRSLGAQGSGATEALVGQQRDSASRIEKLSKAIDKVDAALARLLQGIGMEAFSAEAVKELLTGEPEEAVRRGAQQAQQLSAARERYVQLVDRLSALADQGNQGASIEVPETAFTGTRLWVGEQHTEVGEDLRSVRFCVDQEGLQRGVIHRELGSPAKAPT